ncbi:hypothetical protein [uncultured Roseibium sp.]|uniref:hypothetical protein n=1 Tax=uncultured Roseibium sp. TaxID=1936171 RepID=UPI003216FFF6
MGAERLRDLMAVGRLGQGGKTDGQREIRPEEAYWLARASRNQCEDLTDDQETLTAAYVLGLSLRSGAVEATGTLGQVAKRAAFLAVLFGLPDILAATLLRPRGIECFSPL